MSGKRKYRTFTPKQKVELVLASFRGDRSVAELCREHDLSKTVLRRARRSAEHVALYRPTPLRCLRHVRVGAG